MQFSVLQKNYYRSLKLTLLASLAFLPFQVFAQEAHDIFLPTVAIDEPTVGDELGFVLSNSKNRHHDNQTVHSGEFGAELSKVIFPHFGISIGSNYQRLRLEDRVNSGFDNLEIGGKYEFYFNPTQNLLLSLGLVAELGKTGNRKVDAHSSTSLSPALYFGKGMGNLSDELKYIKPIVLTGLISPTYCTKESKIEDIDLGLAIQYHLRNLNTENNYPLFFNYVIPVVELPLSICTSHHCRRKITGTINPGVLFSGHYLQFGIEATIPVNKNSGRNVGVLVQLHFFLDHIFDCY